MEKEQRGKATCNGVKIKKVGHGPRLVLKAPKNSARWPNGHNPVRRGTGCAVKEFRITSGSCAKKIIKDL